MNREMNRTTLGLSQTIHCGVADTNVCAPKALYNFTFGESRHSCLLRYAKVLKVIN
jgi:hypothetical protein